MSAVVGYIRVTLPGLAHTLTDEQRGNARALRRSLHTKYPGAQLELSYHGGIKGPQVWACPIHKDTNAHIVAEVVAILTRRTERKRPSTT